MYSESSDYLHLSVNVLSRHHNFESALYLSHGGVYYWQALLFVS